MQRVDHTFKAMGGPCRLRLYVSDQAQADAAVNAVVGEVERLESKYSRYRDDSLVSRINRRAGSGEAVAIDAETFALLNYADTVWRESGGLFDLTSGVLRGAWDFKSGRIPEEQQLASLLALVGWDKVHWDAGSIALSLAGMELDFGGCVKEYAADSAAGKLRELHVEHALVDLAGDMVAVGRPPAEDGWTIGIQHPGKKDAAIAQLMLPEGGLASSGDYERCIELDGVRYGHILSPLTGWPVQGLVAVSVLAPQCLVAGSSATVAMLKPRDEGLEWLTSLGLPWLAIDESFSCHGTIGR